MQSSASPVVQALVGFVGSVLCVWGAVAVSRKERRFLATAVRASGVIESLVPGPGPRSPKFPLVRFTTSDGSSISAVPHSSRSFYRVGQKVRVDYDPADPSNMDMHSLSSRWGATAGLAVFAAILFYIGIQGVQQMFAS